MVDRVAHGDKFVIPLLPIRFLRWHRSSASRRSITYFTVLNTEIRCSLQLVPSAAPREHGPVRALHVQRTFLSGMRVYTCTPPIGGQA